MFNLKTSLLAGVSAIAIAAACPESAIAGDLPSRAAIEAKAPAATFRERWTWWVEGGASLFAGDPGVAGMTGFDVDPQRVGWEAAIGFEFRPAMSPWIWSGQFRYGQHGSHSASNNPIGVFFATATPTTPFSITGSNSASRREHHWVADFMVGRDLGLGQGSPTEVKFGVRVAQIRGTTDGAATWNKVPLFPGVVTSCATAGFPFYCVNHHRSYHQKNEFIGAGPRVEVDGSVPLAGGLSFQYMGGAAALYGRRKASQIVNVSNERISTATTAPAVCAASCPFDANSSNNGFVFNLDALAGLAFAFNQNIVLLVSYRFDGYFNALRGYDTNGNVTNLDRFYHGPMVRLTMTN